MKTIKIQHFTDGIIERLFLWFIPDFVKPNHLTYIRIVLTPVIGYLLYADSYIMALILFIIAASTDFLDGTIARRRDLITDIGKVLDPIADKMLILTVLAVTGSHLFIVRVFIVFITFEILAVVLGAIFSYKFGRPIGANVYGKIKMILQSVSLIFVFIGLLIHSPLFILLAEILLFTALLFALASAWVVYRVKSNVIYGAILSDLGIQRKN